MPSTPASPERLACYRRGRASEWVAAAALLARGYRILARRARTPFDKFDLVGVGASASPSSR